MLLVHEIFRIAADRPVDQEIQEAAVLPIGDPAREFRLAGQEIGGELCCPGGAASRDRLRPPDIG